MIATVANATAGITRSKEKVPIPIDMYAVINSSPREAGSSGVEHRRSDDQRTKTNSTTPAIAVFTGLSGWQHRATSRAIPQKHAPPTNTIAIEQ
jgi:hypothetical protein